MYHSYAAAVAHDALVCAALRVVAAEHYGDDASPHSDADAEVAGEKLALAARALVRAVDALPEADQPIGWVEQKPIAAPDEHRIRIYDHKPWHRPNYSVSHPAACDALRYGEKCWLDALIEQYVDALVDPRHDWPDKGRYTVTAPAEGETSLQFTPIDGES